MTTLTAYNSQVQKWTAQPVKTKKMTRLASFMAKFDGIFEAVFTEAKEEVLDHILYLSSANGICTVLGSTLAEKAGVKIRTVRAAVKALKESDQFVVAQTADKRAGAYIFIDKEHENYPLIMKDLFDVDVEPVVIETTHAHQDAPLDAPLRAHLQNVETPATTDVVDEKCDPISFNSFNSIKKDLKPKQELPSNLYGKVCKLLKVVKADALVTKLIRLAEKAKKNIINFTDEHFMYALQESVNYGANDLEAYTASIIYNTASTRKENVTKRAVPVSLQKQVNRPQSAEEAVQAQIEALEQQNKEYAQLHTTQAPNEWFYPKKIEGNNKRIAKLKAELITAQSVEEAPVRDFEAEKNAFLKELAM